MVLTRKRSKGMKGKKHTVDVEDESYEYDRLDEHRTAESSSSEDEAGLNSDEEGYEEDENVDLDMSGRLRMRPAIDMGEDGEMYKGKISSKSAIFDEGFHEEEEGSESEEDDDSAEAMLEDYNQVEGGSASDSGEESLSGTEESEEDEEDEEDDDFLKEYSQIRNDDAQILSTSQLRTEDDREKGLAILSQKKVWERALNVRIRVQKLLGSANKMPQKREFRIIRKELPSLGKEYEEVRRVAGESLACLFEIQKTFLQTCGITTDGTTATTTSSQASSDEEGEEEEEEKRKAEASGNVADVVEGKSRKTEDWWKLLSNCHGSYMSYISNEVDRWQRKTMLTSGNKHALKSLTQTVSSQVRALMQDPSLVSRRTHVTRNSNHRVLCSFKRKERSGEGEGEGEGEGQQHAERFHEEEEEANFLQEEYDFETYDDAEFYQQLLKEFLESQSLTAGDIARSKHGTKRRKVVDRKASKGRKIRYHVHEKLVNFMVPANFDRPEFAETLFGSLFNEV